MGLNQTTVKLKLKKTMKKIFKMMFAVVAGVAALTACTNEPEEGVTPDNTQEYCIVKVGMSDATKGSLTDAEGIKWEVGDQIKYAGGVELVSEALTAEDIEDDGYTANFKFAASLNEVDRTGWFVSTKCHPSNYNEVEFTLGADYGNVYSQAVAGEMNSRYLFLHSGTGLINITKNETPEVEMSIAGAIFRFMPYTETYSNEVVKSVELKSNNGKHIVGTVAYDRGGGTYTSANEVAGSGWKAYPFVRISLDEPFALTNAKSRENSKGIYMAIARTTETHPIEGYTITVKTDVATYTFSSDENLVVGDNELRNVYLKLENGSRVDDTIQKGILAWEETLPENVTLGASAVTDQNIGYIYVKTQELADLGSDKWQKRDKNDANSVYYEGITFETSENWLTVGYAGNDNILVDAEANPNAEERTATLTVTFADANGYLVDDANNSFTVTFTQAAAGSAKAITVVARHTPNMEAENTAYENHRIGGYWVPAVDGVKKEDVNSESAFWNDEEVQKIYGSFSFVCHDGLGAANPVADWIKVYYPRNSQGLINSSNFVVTMDANTSAVQRQSLVTIHITTPDGYVYNGESVTNLFLAQFEITQKAYSAEIVATLNDVYDGTVGYEGDEITVGTLALTADGKAVANANEFCNVAINDSGASVVLAANGTITATIPANASNSAKEYTVTIKDKSGNNLVKDVTINQEPNPKGGEVVEPEHTFSYTIFNNMADGSNNTGLGAGAVSVQYYRFENITIDGTKLNPGTDMTNLVNDTELVNALIDHAFDFGTVTQEDIFDNANVPLDTDPTTFVTLRAWTDGGAAIYVNVELTTNDSGARRTFKIITKDGDGNQVSSIVYFQN